MYNIPINIYIELKEQLIETIDNKDYFSGTIVYDHDFIEVILTITTFIFYDRSLSPTDANSIIYELASVYWDVTTYIKNEKVENDFDFKILKNIIQNEKYR